VLVTQNAGAPLLLRNDTPSHAHWLQVRLQGAKGNRDGIGARLRLTAAGQPELVQTRWIRAGSTYCSSSDPRAFFGLGLATEAERLEIRWPSGAVQTLTHVRADQVLVVKEGVRLP
jgi:enediyne biosynthesis protein E4